MTQTGRAVTASRANPIQRVTLRAFEDRDLDFLTRVYAASRDREMALLPHWTELAKQAFLQEQFRLQHRYYQAHYPLARFDVILDYGEAIGRLYVAPMESEVRLMDIALLPERRNGGIGGALIREVMTEANRSGHFVSLHVEPDNPARRLYTRLGFIHVEIVGAYTLMHWRGDGAPDVTPPAPNPL